MRVKQIRLLNKDEVIYCWYANTHFEAFPEKYFLNSGHQRFPVVYTSILYVYDIN